MFFVAGPVDGGSSLVLGALTVASGLNLGSHIIVQHDEQLPELANHFATSDPVSCNKIIMARMGLLCNSLDKGQGAVAAGLVQTKVKQRPWFISIYKC